MINIPSSHISEQKCSAISCLFLLEQAACLGGKQGPRLCDSTGEEVMQALRTANQGVTLSLFTCGSLASNLTSSCFSFLIFSGKWGNEDTYF